MPGSFARWLAMGGAASFAKRWSCGRAGCLLRDESSALSMTAQLRHGRGGEKRCRPQRRCSCPTLTNAA